MLAQPRSEQDDFLAQTKKWYGKLALQDDLKRLRAAAWERYLEVGLPTKRTEVYRYIRLRHLFGKQLKLAAATPLLQGEIAPYLYPECRGSALVFVNGFFRPELSERKALPESVVVMPLHDAMRTYGAFLQNQWSFLTKEESDPFALLNAALQPAGLFLYIPPKTTLARPIQILHLIENRAEQTMLFPRAHIFIGREAEAQFCHRVVEKESHGYCVSEVFDLALDEASSVKCSFELMGQSPDVWALQAVRASLKRNSSLLSVCLTDGAMTERSDYRVALLGEGADVSLNGLSMLDDRREAHQNVCVEHKAPHCRSNQFFKGVLTDVARSSFEGKILVRQKAQKTEAYQLNKNLVLSDKANVDCKPNLEIFADDVKASHGATIGQLEPEQLFYLETRGVPKEMARNLLISGFCKEIIDLAFLDSMRARYTKQAAHFLV